MITACCEENIDQQSSAHYMDLLCRKQFFVKWMITLKKDKHSMYKTDYINLPLLFLYCVKNLVLI